MFDLFSYLPVRNKDLPAGSVQTLIHVHEREMFTGVLHLQKPDGGQAALFFVQGILLLFYSLSDGYWAALPATDWRMSLAHAAGDLRILPLPVDGLRTFRLFLDASEGQVDTFSGLPATVVPDKIGEWQRASTPSLIHIHRNEMVVFLVLPGNALTSTDALLLSPDRFQTGLGVLTQLRSWGERPCDLIHCGTDLGSPAGQEYGLRVSFLKLVQKTLERYQELAGRFLVSALAEEINRMTRERGWSLTFAGTGLTHREFFTDAYRAGEAYRAILSKMESEMELVVGSRVAGQIVQQARLELSPISRGWLDEYVLAKAQFAKQYAEAV
jgi:hypothetical protein